MTCIAVHSTWHYMYACMILMNKEWKKQFRADPSQRMYTGSTTSSRETIGVGDVATMFACCVLRVASCEGGIDHRHLCDCTPEGNVEGNYIFESADDSILRHLHLHECTSGRMMSMKVRTTSTWHY